MKILSLLCSTLLLCASLCAQEREIRTTPITRSLLTNRTVLELQSFLGGTTVYTNGLVAVTNAVTPEQFGAVSDGNTLDDAAFAAAAAWCEVNNGPGHSTRLEIGNLGARYKLSQTVLITNGFEIVGPRPYNNPYYSITGSNTWTILFTGNTNLFYSPTNYSVHGMWIHNLEAVGPWNYANAAVNTNSCFWNIQGFNHNTAYVGQHNVIEGVGLKSWGIGVWNVYQALFHLSDCWFQDTMQGVIAEGNRGVYDRLTVTGVASNGFYQVSGDTTLNHYQPLVTGYALNTCPTNGNYIVLNDPWIETYGLNWSNWPVNLHLSTVGSFGYLQWNAGTAFSDGVACPMINASNYLVRFNGAHLSADANGFAVVSDDTLNLLSMTDNEWSGIQVTNRALGKTYYAPQTHYSPLMIDHTLGIMPSAISNSMLFVNGPSLLAGNISTPATMVWSNSALADAAPFRSYLIADPISTGKTALQFDSTAADHDIYFGSSASRLYNPTFYTHNQFAVDCDNATGGGISLTQNGASWSIWSASSSTLSIEASAGARPVWEAQFLPANQVAANTFQLPNGTGGISLLARGVAGQTGDLIEAQDSASNTLFSVSANGTLNGNAVGLTNFNADFPTNRLAVAGVWDISKPSSYFATNTTFGLTLTGLPTTSDRTATIMLSNSAASGAIAAIMPPGFVCMTNGVPAAAIWMTNLSAKAQVTLLTVKCYGPGNTNGVAAQFYAP